jgi:hypothetical protein
MTIRILPEQDKNSMPIDRVDLARRYRRRGYCPVAIPSGQKGPRIPGWQNLLITDENVEAFFKGSGNIGIILGEKSGGLTDVDLDCVEAIELAPKVMPATDSKFGRNTKRRSHWLYIVDGPAPTARFSDPISGKTLLELRGDGGLQTVFPGSIHPSGELIEWETDGQPAAISPAELCKRGKWLAACCLVKRYCQNVTDYASLLRALEIVDPRVAERICVWLGIRSSQDAPCRPLNGFDLGPLPPHLLNQTRPRLAPQLAASLSELRGEYQPAQAGPIFGGCAQLRELRDNAANQGRDSWWSCLGVLAYCEHGDKIAHELSSKHAKYTHEETQRELDGWRRKTTGATLCRTFDRKNPGICDKCPHWGKINSPISLGISLTEPSASADAFVISGDELLSTEAPKRRWFVEPFVPADETTMLGGDGGAGKTTLGLQLSIAAVSGQDWLGFKVNSCNVLYVARKILRMRFISASNRLPSI